MSSQGAWTWVVDAFLRPRRFLRLRHAESLRSTDWFPKEVVSIAGLLTTNFLAYVVPVVAIWSASGSTDVGAAVFALALPFLFLTGLTAWAFHAGLVVTGNALGLKASVRSVVVAISIYLSLGLGFGFPYLAGSQSELAQFLRHATLLAFTISTGGEAIEAIRSPQPVELALGVVGFGYFVLAVYLMSRIASTTSRRAAVFVTLLTVGTPLIIAPLIYSTRLLGPTYYAVVAIYSVILAAAAPLDILRRFRFQL
jgi:hypothetical protein